MATEQNSKPTDQPTVKLHWLDRSRAQGILWLLEELKVPYELEIYHRQENLLAPPELTKLHPLGKSPVVTILPAGAPLDSQPVVLAETGFIAKYLCDHFGETLALVPKRWKDGQEGRIGGETEEWMRCQHLLQYAEGSFMPYQLLTGLMEGLKGSAVPFLIRPITSAIANRVTAFLVFPNVRANLAFLEKQLETSPAGGGYLCGAHLTAADIVMAFPLLVGKPTYAGLGRWEKGSPQETFPKVWAYMARIENEPGWKKSADKIRSIEGKFAVAPGSEAT